MAINRRTRYVNFLAISTLIALLLVLFVGRGINLYDIQYPEQLIGVILIGSGLMMLIENAFDKQMDMRASDDLQFIIGVPGSLVAILLGVGFTILDPMIVGIFGGFEGGIYLTAIAIIVAERITNTKDWNPRLKDFTS